MWTEVPSFESSSVLYISPTDTSSMQNLILEGLQQKLQKSCSRCNKNTRHIESSYILQPPKYLLLFVNRFRYINNNINNIYIYLWNILILGIWCSTIPHLPGCFLSLDLLWEYRNQHGPLYVTSSYSTWIFCRGVSGFATDCPCGVWFRGLTTCLLYVGPPFGNRILNNSWAVGLT